MYFQEYFDWLAPITPACIQITLLSKIPLIVIQIFCFFFFPLQMAINYPSPNCFSFSELFELIRVDKFTSLTWKDCKQRGIEATSAKSMYL